MENLGRLFMNEENIQEAKKCFHTLAYNYNSIEGMFRLGFLLDIKE